MQKEFYQIAGKTDSRKIAEFSSKDDQLLFPLLRGLKLTLMFYYTKGMVSKSREGFKNIYGNNAKKFKRKLYEIYENDKLRKS